ncbi:cell number regulator 2-like [Triticum urartu]|uniref:Cell number regulator 2 n=1 Tax=Triticum urartu TaxID=4572 RepID=A0A8R7P8W7_TRIUA|nr:cell number regulator 2-like [Triticum urartu]
MASRNVNGAAWSTGLCGCCDDVGGCFLTWCFPCITFGRIAEIVDEGEIPCCASGSLYVLMCMTTGLGMGLYSCFYRYKLRRAYGLAEKPCADCCVHFFCGACALCQEYREVKNRGFHMHLGWQANAEKMGKGTTVAPHVVPGMTR